MDYESTYKNKLNIHFYRNVLIIYVSQNTEIYKFLLCP